MDMIQIKSAFLRGLISKIIVKKLGVENFYLETFEIAECNDGYLFSLTCAGEVSKDKISDILSKI